MFSLIQGEHSSHRQYKNKSAWNVSLWAEQGNVISQDFITSCKIFMIIKRLLGYFSADEECFIKQQTHFATSKVVSVICLIRALWHFHSPPKGDSLNLNSPILQIPKVKVSSPQLSVPGDIICTCPPCFITARQDSATVKTIPSSVPYSRRLWQPDTTKKSEPVFISQRSIHQAFSCPATPSPSPHRCCCH